MSTRYRWPVALGLISLFFFILAAWAFVLGFGGWSASFTGPGTVTISLPEAGDYRLWHESKTVIDGQFQILDDALPNGTVIGFENQQGATVPMVPYSGSMTQEWDGRRRFALGRVDIPQAGPYTVSVTGFDQPRRFRMTEIRFLDHFLRALALGLIGTALATVALVQVLVLSAKKP